MEEYKKTLEYLDSIDLSPMLLECYQRHMTDIQDIYEVIANKVEVGIGEFVMTFDELVDYLIDHYQLYIQECIQYEFVPFSSRNVYFRKRGSSDNE